MPEEIVITGLGIASPIGCSEKLYWEALRKGRSGASPVDGLDTTNLPRKTACQVREPIEVGRPMGRAAQLAVHASRQAARSAGVSPTDLADCRVTTIVGTTMGETDFIEERLDAPEADWLSPKHVERIISGKPGSIAANVRADLGVHGAATDLYGACAAGNMALESARRDLLAGQCDLAFAGGADGFSRLAFIGFMRLRVMAAEVCRPFDEQRDGLLVGEGAAMFVLERESSAGARGVPIRVKP